MRVPLSLKDLLESAETLVYIEDLSDRNGLMQTINPVAKLVTIIAMLIAALFIFHFVYLLVICLVPLGLAMVSRISLKQFLPRTILIPLFMGLISVPTLFLTAGNPIWALNIAGMNLMMTVEGVTRLFVFTVRIWFCVASLNLLILSTGFDKTLKLFSSLHVPHLIIQLFSLTYRYFFVSIHETQSILIAKEARTYINRRTLNLQGLKDLGTILSSLFIRTYERSERVYLAMKARGFEINKSNNPPISVFHVKDVVFTVSIIVTFTYIALL